MVENPRTTPGIQVALSIAGSDSGGGAGMQADLKTFAALDVYGCTVLTAVTAQNTTGVKQSTLLDPELVEAQIDAVAGDIKVDAIKTGMLGSAEIVKTVLKAINRHNLFPLVVDPVVVAKGGQELIDEETLESLKRHLLPLAAIVTPNGHEAARLIGRSDPIDDVPTAAAAAEQICSRHGAKACVVTGIRRPNDEEGEAVDLYFDGEQVQEVVSDWRPTDNTHGAGCTFSAALTAALALGQPLGEAVPTAKSFVAEAIRQATDLGHGHGPVNHLAYAKVTK